MIIKQIFPYQPRVVKKRGGVSLCRNCCSLDLGAGQKRREGSLMQNSKFY